MTVTKKQFLLAYQDPSKFVKFMYQNFGGSKFTIAKIILISIFIIFNVLCAITKYLVFLYIAMTPLVIVVLGGFTAVILNNLRIKRICQKLKISDTEYRELCYKYIGEE